MKFKSFESQVKSRFPHLICEETTDRRGNPMYATTDWSVTYNPQNRQWTYSESKSSSGTGKTLEQAIANLDSSLSLYDEY